MCWHGLPQREKGRAAPPPRCARCCPATHGLGDMGHPRPRGHPTPHCLGASGIPLLQGCWAPGQLGDIRHQCQQTGWHSEACGGCNTPVPCSQAGPSPFLTPVARQDGVSRAHSASTSSPGQDWGVGRSCHPHPEHGTGAGGTPRCCREVKPFSVRSWLLLTAVAPRAVFQGATISC